MRLAEIYGPIQPQLDETQALFVEELKLGSGLIGELTRYVSLMPGKRMRPALTIAAAGLFPAGRRPAARKRVVQLAAAVEMIHTATLLHDDVIDGAALRRGLSTINAKWGDTLSVLSGDYLYSKAFCLLAELDHGAVLKLLSDTARLVCVGEVSQIQHRFDIHLSRQRYLKIIEWKTASLLRAAAEAGALLGGSGPADAARCRSFGLNFGLAFQILDDMQDLVGEESALGKSLGTDLSEGQVTLPMIYLRDAAGARASRMLAQCFNGHANGNGNGHTAPVDSDQARLRYRRLQKEAVKHQVPAYCRRVAGRYLAQARAALKPFPDSESKQLLLQLTNHLVR
ncbi:MAG: hypothetical protein COV76_05550 [Candidatus Omnitrophica bacterium CG11_big_fil_rev_8_21_14_0_20_64_10]|nr:MAG: hypothetical protein COV76_05550 [Candidatus Omnitrophica bacterium CG11_big_fil_rev_8_21_14_0_20_64_10]